MYTNAAITRVFRRFLGSERSIVQHTCFIPTYLPTYLYLPLYYILQPTTTTQTCTNTRTHTIFEGTANRRRAGNPLTFSDPPPIDSVKSAYSILLRVCTYMYVRSRGTPNSRTSFHIPFAVTRV